MERKCLLRLTLALAIYNNKVHTYRTFLMRTVLCNTNDRCNNKFNIIWTVWTSNVQS